jgi:trehalose synthase-like protein
MSSGMPIPRLIHLDDYRAVLGDPEVAELRAQAAPLQGRTVQMVNSTAVGGGVAEILTRLVPILQELGLAIRWDVITGANDFFEIAKRSTTLCMEAPMTRRRRAGTSRLRKVGGAFGGLTGCERFRRLPPSCKSCFPHAS